MTYLVRVISWIVLEVETLLAGLRLPGHRHQDLGEACIVAQRVLIAARDCGAAGAAVNWFF